MGNDFAPKLTIKDTQRRADIVACAALVVLNAVWLLTLRLPFFHVDDASYIVENPYVRNGLSWQSLSWAFTTSFGDYWHPLAWISLSLDSTVFGTNPWGYHLTNALLHMANAVLVYLFFRRSTGMWWQSLVAAALFSLHPQRVESVAWATERKDVLAGFFGLLSLLVYLRFTRETSGKKSGLYLLLCGLFVCSMLAKPLLVTFPVLLLLLDVWPLGRWAQAGTGWRAGLWLLMREKVLLFLLAFAGALNTYMYVFTKGSFRGSPSMGVKNAGLNYVLYLRDFVWPAWLSFFYRAKTELPVWQALGAWALVGAISLVLAVAGWRGSTGWRPLLIGWLWFILSMLPTSGLLQPGYSMRGDRFMYIPTLGLIVMLVWGILPSIRAPRFTPMAALASVAIIALGICTVNRLLLWHDPLSLYEHDLALDPGNAYLEQCAGVAAAEKHLDRLAQSHFKEASRLDSFDFIYLPESVSAPTSRPN